jgi:hypothetical protein
MVAHADAAANYANYANFLNKIMVAHADALSNARSLAPSKKPLSIAQKFSRRHAVI